MNRLKQILCSKRAFTLIETIVASTVSSIVLIGVLGFFIPTSDNMTKTQMLNDAKLVSELIIAELDKQIRYANSVTIYDSASAAPPTSTADNIVIYDDTNGAPTQPFNLLHIKKNGSTTTEPLVASDFYGRIRCEVIFTPIAPGGGLKVTIKTHLNSRPGTVLLETVQVIKIYNGVANYAAGVTDGDYIVAVMPT